MFTDTDTERPKKRARRDRDVQKISGYDSAYEFDRKSKSQRKMDALRHFMGL